jgi:hypothetical protein
MPIVRRAVSLLFLIALAAHAQEPALVREGAVIPVRAPGAAGVRAVLDPVELPPGARLEVFTSSSVLHQVVTADQLARGARVPAEPEPFLDGDTVFLRLKDAGGAAVRVASIERAPGPEWASALAARYAPHIFQDVDETDRRADLIAAFDFDGNVNGDDNWDNLALAKEFPLGGQPEHQAAVYWWAAESSTHAFVGYAFFHPRDWDHLPWFNRDRREHVNDMEGMLLAVRKETGQPEILYVVNHRDYRQYADPALFRMRRVQGGGPTTDGDDAREALDGRLELRAERPAVYIEAQGHGVTGRAFENWLRGPKYDGVKGDGVHYQPGTYPLKPITPLWDMARDPEHSGPGRAFHDIFAFQGQTHGSKHSANPPWGWNDQHLIERGYRDGRGTLFTDPGGLIAWQFECAKPFDPKLIRKSW